MRIFLLLLLSVASAMARADGHALTLPVKADKVHEGVATCAGSMCHGSVKQYENTNILHNEYITWDRHDVHHRAYNKLFEDDFVQITNKLGLKAPHEEPLCLNCHASNVPVDKRGRKFQMTDGIGCETCHGGSEQWLRSHTDKGATHAQNVATGLYPTADIVSRARLCMSCHYGNRDQFVTHEIMGAGHPRISFELDTFTELQPKHFEQDADYRERKTAYTNIKAWAVGQAIASESVLDMILSERMQGHGLFPELSMFDCHSCHHPMSDKSWTPRRGTGLKPGDVPLNDANMLMLRHVVTALDKTRGWQFRKQARALQAAAADSIGALREHASGMRDTVSSLTELIVAHEFSATDVSNITRGLINEGIWEGYSDYVAAEQCVMALSVLVISWDELNALDEAARSKVRAEIDRMYALVQDDEAYDPAAFSDSLRTMRQTLGLDQQ